MSKTQPKTIREELLDEIKEFMAKHDMAATRFGILAASNPHAVHRLIRGEVVTDRRIDKLREFMRNYENTKARPKSRSLTGAAA